MHGAIHPLPQYVYVGWHLVKHRDTLPLPFTFTRGSFLGSEADSLPASGAKIKNAYSYTSTHQYVFMAWCLMKQWIWLYGVVLSYAQGQLYLYFYVSQGCLWFYSVPSSKY